MAFRLATITEDRELGSLPILPPGEDDRGQMVLHIFGKENVDVWENGTDLQRVSDVARMINMIGTAFDMSGLSLQEVVTLYNQMVPDGGHALEYLPKYED